LSNLPQTTKNIFTCICLHLYLAICMHSFTVQMHKTKYLGILVLKCLTLFRTAKMQNYVCCCKEQFYKNKRLIFAQN